MRENEAHILRRSPEQIHSCLSQQHLTPCVELVGTVHNKTIVSN